MPAQRNGASRQWTPGLLALAALGVALILSSCNVNIGATSGSGVVKTETRSISGVSKVEFSGVGELAITQAPVESLTVSAEDNLLPLLTSTVSGDTLSLGVKSGSRIIPTKPIVFTLTVTQLSAVTLSGAGSINAVNISVPALDVTLSGAGQMTISGSAPSQTALVSGVGSYNAKAFQTDATQVTISGTGSATVSASKTLDATVSGAGSVTYYGSPQVTQSVSGVGSIKQGK